MKMVVSLFTVLALLGCEAPRSRRTVRSLGQNSDSLNKATPAITDDGISLASGEVSGATSENYIPEEIRHCKWSSDGQTGFADNHYHLGEYTVCQSNTNEKKIYIQVKNPMSTERLCIYPTTNSGSESWYIGPAKCVHLYEAKKIYTLEMVVESYYQQRPLTGVMMMKDLSHHYPFPFDSYQAVRATTAYQECIRRSQASIPDPRYCQAFVQVGQYRYVTFR